MPLNDLDDSPTKSLTRTPRARASAQAHGEEDTESTASLMSFAFKGSDQVRPARARPAGIPSALGPQRRPSSGAAQAASHAKLKFAHRLRTDVEPGDDGPLSKARRSLPPAMAVRANAGAMGSSRAGSVTGGAHRALGSTDRNISGGVGLGLGRMSPSIMNPAEPKAVHGNTVDRVSLDGARGASRASGGKGGEATEAGKSKMAMSVSGTGKRVVKRASVAAGVFGGPAQAEDRGRMGGVSPGPGTVGSVRAGMKGRELGGMI
jgi:hypothetical protein